MRLTITARADDFIGARVSGATSNDAARLIGAAPELLAALRAMLATVHDEERDDATVAAIAHARAAIAKATGEA